MTPKQITLVQEAWQKIKPISSKAAEIFYNTLFEMDPPLKSLFKSNIKEQGSKLITMLDAAIKLLDEPEKLQVTIKKLQAKNIVYKLNKSHYDVVESAFIKTLEVCLGTSFTVTLKKAWISVNKQFLNNVLVNTFINTSIVNDNTQMIGKINKMNEITQTSENLVKEVEYREMLARLEAISKAQG